MCTLPAGLVKKIKFRPDNQNSKIKNRSDHVGLQKADKEKDQVSLKSPR
jgi:hypothetical protein